MSEDALETCTNLHTRRWWNEIETVTAFSVQRSQRGMMRDLDNDRREFQGRIMSLHILEGKLVFRRNRRVFQDEMQHHDKNSACSADSKQLD
jgi:hypothetical protein